MTEKVETEKKLAEKPQKPEKPKKSIWSNEDKKLISSYGCQLLAEDATNKQLLEKKLPTDTMIITYKVEDKLHHDLVRGPQTKIFDLYYDKFGKGSLQRFEYGMGTINPTTWGYQAPQKKRKRKL